MFKKLIFGLSLWLFATTLSFGANFDDGVNAYEKGDLYHVSAILLVEYYDKVYKKPLKIDATYHNTNLIETANALSHLNPFKLLFTSIVSK